MTAFGPSLRMLGRRRMYRPVSSPPTWTGGLPSATSITPRSGWPCCAKW